MKKRTMALLLAACMTAGMLTACGGNTGSSAADGAPASVSQQESAPEATQTAPEAIPAAPESSAESIKEEAPAPESAAEDVESTVPEESAAEEAKTCTVTFFDGQTFEATVGEDFVFFFQCDAPGDMGEPQPGEEGAGITVSDGTVTYSNVGLGGPYSYPTSEKVTISGFTGDFDVTITEAATYMDATYTIYTDEQDIADAIAFAEEMAKQQAANPMP